MRPPHLSEAELLSSLIGAIYDCALDPGRWPETLTDIRTAIDFANAMLTVWRAPQGELLLNVVSGIEPRYAAELERHGPEIVAQWGGAAAIGAFAIGEPKVLSWERPRATWSAGAYYKDWLEPQGLSDLMAVAVTRDRGTYCSVGFARHRSVGEIGAGEVAFTRLLVPHIERAVTVSRLLDVQAVSRSTLGAVLDALPSPVLVVDADLLLLHTNSAGRLLLGKGGALSDHRGRLQVRQAASAAAVRALVTAGDSGLATGAGGIPLVDGTRPMLLHVLPLREGALRPGLVSKAAAAILVAEGDTQRPPDPAIVALFDFTPAEARMFAELAAGGTLVECAARMGISAGTAKTHLRRLFEKTGTHRQADLLRLADSLALPR